MNHSMPGLPVHHQLPESTQTHSIELVMPSNRLILCRSLLLLPSIFPSIRVFSKVSAFRIRWPKYWSFSFSISPSNEYSGLISFRMNWLDLLSETKCNFVPYFPKSLVNALSYFHNFKNKNKINTFKNVFKKGFYLESIYLLPHLVINKCFQVMRGMKMRVGVRAKHLRIKIEFIPSTNSSYKV